MRNNIYPLENQLFKAQPHTLSDHELNSVAAGQEAQKPVPSPVFASDSDAPGLGNCGFQVGGQMSLEEFKNFKRQRQEEDRRNSPWGRLFI